MTSAGMTVVIPTLNRESFVLEAVADLLVQRYAPIEILIVDQSDRPSEAIQRLASEHSAQISYFHVTDFRGLPNARNFAWKNARYGALLFLDDDIRCGPDLVAEHWRCLNLPGVGVVAGGIDEAKDPNPKPMSVGHFGYWTGTPTRGFASHEERDVDHAPGGNFSIWREVLERVGGFDEAFNFGSALYEETEYCLRVRKAGYKIYFSGKARLTHLAASSGGCRVLDVPKYMLGLSHNRAMLVRRVASWYHLPSALGRWLMLVASYTRSSRNPKVVVTSVRGAVMGWKRGAAVPQVTSFARQSPNKT